MRASRSLSAWTENLWIYDLRTNKHFTHKENPLQGEDLDEFVACYNPKNRHERKESERFKSFSYEDLLKRDKLNLDFLRNDEPPFADATHFLTGWVTAAFCFSLPCLLRSESASVGVGIHAFNFVVELAAFRGPMIPRAAESLSANSMLVQRIVGHFEPPTFGVASMADRRHERISEAGFLRAAKGDKCVRENNAPAGTFLLPDQVELNAQALSEHDHGWISQADVFIRDNDEAYPEKISVCLRELQRPIHRLFLMAATDLFLERRRRLEKGVLVAGQDLHFSLIFRAPTQLGEDFV